MASSELALAAGTCRTLPHRLRVGAIESISSFVLPHPLAEFRRRWPTVDVQVATSVCADLRARLHHADFEAVITLDGDIAQDQGSIGAVKLHLIARPGYALMICTSVVPVLTDETLLLPDADGPLTDLIGSWADRGGFVPRIVSAGSIEGVKRGVLNGDAVGVLPVYAVADDLATGLLVTLEGARGMPSATLRFLTVGTPATGTPLANLFSYLHHALQRKHRTIPTPTGNDAPSTPQRTAS